MAKGGDYPSLTGRCRPTFPTRWSSLTDITNFPGEPWCRLTSYGEVRPVHALWRLLSPSAPEIVPDGALGAKKRRGRGPWLARLPGYREATAARCRERAGLMRSRYTGHAAGGTRL